MKKSIYKLVSIKNLLEDKEWHTTTNIMFKLNIVDYRVVYSAIKDLQDLGFRIEKTNGLGREYKYKMF